MSRVLVEMLKICVKNSKIVSSNFGRNVENLGQNLGHPNFSGNVENLGQHLERYKPKMFGRNLENLG